MDGLMNDIHELLPTIPKYRIYKVMCSIRARYNKYGVFGLGRRDGPKFGISERQMPKLITLLIDYGFLDIKGESSNSRNGFKCRIFKLSRAFKELILSMRDYIKKSFEYINPTEFVKVHFQYKIQGGNIEFKVNGNKYKIHKRGRFKGVIYDTIENKIIAPYNLIG